METPLRLALTGLAAIALLVSGCAVTTHYRNAANASYGQVEFDRDNYQCQRENQHQVMFAAGGVAQANDVVDDRMAAACLAARGWRKVEPVTQPPVITATEAYNHGVAAYQLKQYGQAMQWYRKAADQGYADAQITIGVMYENGQGVTQDNAEAIRWYRKAAEQGSANAQYNLGIMYERGWGITQDNAEAIRWYRKAAEQGNANAQYNLGVMYHSGLGVTQDYAEAMGCYRKAAEQGKALAQNNLGAMYYSGQGVTQDYAEAMRWFRKAAEQGNAGVQDNIGRLYQNGQGVPQDYVQALTWYSLAASRYPEAVKHRDALAVKMTPAQIAQAQGLAREWMSIRESK